MPRSSKCVVEERKLSLLAYLAQLSLGRRPQVACVSLRRMATDLGISEVRVRHALRCLMDEGLLESEYRFGGNGGQLENAYRLTSKGRAWLKKMSQSPEVVRQE